MYILFFSCFLSTKRKKTWYFRPIFRESPLFPPGWMKSPANSESKWCDLGEHWTLKGIMQKSSRSYNDLCWNTPNNTRMYLWSLCRILHSFWNPTYILESQKRIGNGIPESKFGILFFFRLESHGIRRFFPWNPKESRRFFLESQGIYTSLGAM